MQNLRRMEGRTRRQGEEKKERGNEGRRGTKTHQYLSHFPWRVKDMLLAKSWWSVLTTAQKERQIKEGREEGYGTGVKGVLAVCKGREKI